MKIIDKQTHVAKVVIRTMGVIETTVELPLVMTEPEPSPCPLEPEERKMLVNKAFEVASAKPGELSFHVVTADHHEQPMVEQTTLYIKAFDETKGFDRQMTRSPVVIVQRHLGGERIVMQG